LTNYLKKHASTPIHILIKGSRGMKMEEIVKIIINQNQE